MKLGSDYMRAAEREHAQRARRELIEAEAGNEMASVNRVILLGNLGKDPEIKYLPSGQMVCNFSIATSDKWTDQSGQPQERTEWHKIVVWGKQAESAAKYLKKGKSAFIEGRIQTRQWDDSSGQRRTTTEVLAESVRFMSPKDHEDRAG